MDDTKINKYEIDQKKQLLEKTKNSDIVDTSIFDETLKEIDLILNNLEQKLEVEHDQIKKLDVLPDINSVMSKIHTAKNELIKEENNLIKKNNLIKRIEDLEENNNKSNEESLESKKEKQHTIADIKEHKIDNDLLSIEELQNFHENIEKKVKNSFGFYAYLTIVVVSFLALYGILNISKNLIILKYPNTEVYIDYFYEIIEIIKVTISNLAGSIN